MWGAVCCRCVGSLIIVLVPYSSMGHHALAVIWCTLSGWVLERIFHDVRSTMNTWNLMVQGREHDQGTRG